MYKFGIIGLPNAGKSTLFNILTLSNVLTADYPFSTITPNKAVFKLFDSDTLKLAQATKSQGLSLPEVELWDIAGLIEGAAQGEGLGNEFLGYIQQCDLLIHVVRQTDSKSGHTLRDIGIIDMETALFDHQLLKKHFEKARRMVHLYPNDKGHQSRNRVLTKAYETSAEGRRINDIISDEELDSIQEVELITAKPKIEVLNHNIAEVVYKGDGIKVNLLDLATITSLTDSECEALGYSKQDVDSLMSKIFDEFLKHLKLKKFYTVGDLGVGLWVVPKDAKVEKCASVLHSEMDIRGARVARYEDFLKLKTWPEVISSGLSKKCGTNFVPEGGSIIIFE